MRHERPHTRASRQVMKFHAFLAKAFGYLYWGKFCECAERADAPALERFQKFWRGFKHG